MIRIAYKSSALIMLATVIVSYISIVPSVNRQLDIAQQSPSGYVVIAAVLTVFGINALVLWVSGVLYVWNRSYQTRVKRLLATGLFVLGNFPLAFFYYFLGVVRHPISLRGNPTLDKPRTGCPPNT